MSDDSLPGYVYAPDDFGLTEQEVIRNFPTTNEECEEKLNWNEFNGLETPFSVELIYHPVVWVDSEEKSYVLTNSKLTQKETFEVDQVRPSFTDDDGFIIETKEEYTIESDRLIFKLPNLVGVWDGCIVK